MAGPTLRRISSEDYPDAPDWFQRFLDTLNPFLGDTSNTLSGNLTPSNFRRQIETFRVDTQSTVSATFASGKVQIKNKLGAPPKEVRIGQIYPRTSGASLIQDPWHAPTFENSWVNWGSPNPTAGYMIDALGFVHTKGVVKNGTMSATIFTLPTGYRPAERVPYVSAAAGVFALMVVETDGRVAVGAGANTSVQLDGLVFLADTSVSTAPVGWELLQSGQIRINWINGLAPSKSYDVTLVVE